MKITLTVFSVSFAAFINSCDQGVQPEPVCSMVALDSTSHVFTWIITELGEGGGSILRDVAIMHLYPPYGGKTREGVGIGMIREQALKYLPPPDSTYSPFEGVIDDLYFYEKNFFGVRYHDNKIYLI